jgi:lipoate-protein ligase B
MMKNKGHNQKLNNKKELEEVWNDIAHLISLLEQMFLDNFFNYKISQFYWRKNSVGVWLKVR